MPSSGDHPKSEERQDETQLREELASLRSQRQECEAKIREINERRANFRNLNIHRRKTPMHNADVEERSLLVWRDQLNQRMGQVEELLRALNRSPQVDEAPSISKAQTPIIGSGPPRAKTGQITDQDRADAQRILKNPSKYPSMTARQVAAALGISIKAVYEHPLLERYETGNRTRRWTTKSVLDIINSQSQ